MKEYNTFNFHLSISDFYYIRLRVYKQLLPTYRCNDVNLALVRIWLFLWGIGGELSGHFAGDVFGNTEYINRHLKSKKAVQQIAMAIAEMETTEECQTQIRI